jgi:hypothetical protein
LRTDRSLIPVAPLAAVLAVVLAVAAAGPAAASAPPTSRAAVAPAAESAQPTAGRTAVPGRTAAAGAARPEAGNLTGQVVSPNFTGYEASGGSYTSVSASWVEPTVECLEDSTFITISVSINGYPGSSPQPNPIAEDLGTEANCATGTPVYSDYYSLEQAYSMNTYGDTVEPGDNLSASITYIGSSEYTYVLQDGTQGWTEDHTYSNPGAPTGNAEIGLREWPGDFMGPVNFGAVGFGNATINGTGLSAIGARSYIEGGNGNPDQTSISTVKAANGSFMMFYGAGGNVDANPMVAFEANYTGLWTSVAGLGGYAGQLLAPGTSPSIAVLSDNGFEVAFQNADGDLEILGTDFNLNTEAGMMAGTSPSIAAGPNGTFEVAWEANSSVLWTFSPATYGVDQSYGMKAGTSPAITAVSGGYEIAFQANTDVLWTVGASGNIDTGQGMAAASSPAIATNSANVFEVAFQSNNGQVWTYTVSNGGENSSYPIMAGTDPAIAALANNSFEVAFQSWNGYLWEYGSYYTDATSLGMLAGTSPSITADPSTGFEVAFQANSTALWIQTPSGGGVDWGSGMHSGSSPSIAY